jgi:hypothetical protein
VNGAAQVARAGTGVKVGTYDERNRLWSDGDYTYGHSPRGGVVGYGLTVDDINTCYEGAIGAHAFQWTGTSRRSTH